MCPEECVPRGDYLPLMTQQHSCSDHWPRPDGPAQEWTCPECGSSYVSTRAKYVLGAERRTDVGYTDPELLGWRGDTRDRN